MLLNRLLCLAFLCASFFLSAQTIHGELDFEDTSTIHRITMSEGDQFVGRILSIENLNVKFKLEGLEQPMHFNLNAVEAIEVLTPEQYEDGYTYLKDTKVKLRGPAPMHSRTHIVGSRTGIGLGKGNKAYRNIMALYNEMHFGVHKNLDVGVSLIPLLVSNILSFQVKGHVSVGEYLHLGLGVNTYLALIHIEGSNFGIAHTYFAATLGPEDYHINLNVGYGFPFLDTQVGAPVYSIGGSFRTGDRWRIITEGVFVSPRNSNVPLFATIAMGWFNHKHKFDFGITSLIFDNLSVYFVPIPNLSYGLKF